MFNAELRGAARNVTQLNRLLSQLGLQEKVRRSKCHNLSGGELKRVRVAAELISEPQLLVLDEPASGLDRGREKDLMRLLRTLSYRGCTVIVVTHSEHNLDDFDRILELRDRQRVFWGTPAEQKRPTPSGNLDLREVKSNAPDAVAQKSAKPVQLSSIENRKRRQSPWRQSWTLLRRELALLDNAPLRRVVVPLAILPAFFAAAIGCAVKPGDLHLIGFLSILSCIWMGASLSLMSIVDEREVFDHERLLFLHVRSYVFAKTAVLWVLSIVQTVLFVVLLCLVRWWVAGGEVMLFGPPWCAAVLTVVGLAAVGAGLLISALAGTNRPLAAFILPLAMMAQIVFSVEVAGHGDASLASAYGEFNPHWCKEVPGCPHRAQFWQKPGDSSSYGWTCGKNHRKDEPQESPEEIKQRNAGRPNLWAACASYATISRYGDIVLRSFAYSSEDYKFFHSRNESEDDYPRWRHQAEGVLLLMSLGLAGLVVPVLYWQQGIIDLLERCLSQLRLQQVRLRAGMAQWRRPRARNRRLGRI